MEGEGFFSRENSRYNGIEVGDRLLFLGIGLNILLFRERGRFDVRGRGTNDRGFGRGFWEGRGVCLRCICGLLWFCD